MLDEHEESIGFENAIIRSIELSRYHDFDTMENYWIASVRFMPTGQIIGSSGGGYHKIRNKIKIDPDRNEGEQFMELIMWTISDIRRSLEDKGLFAPRFTTIDDCV